MPVNDTVLARILIDDQTNLGFNSYARNVERAKKTSEAFRKHAIDKISLGLEKQVQVLKKTAKEYDLLQAANMGANKAQLEHIESLHAAIEAHHAAEKAAEDKRKADEEAIAVQNKIDSAVNKASEELKFQAATAKMTADEIQIYKLEMMGASAAQIQAVKNVQQSTEAMRKQSKAANVMHGQFRLMRGGLGQLGHQVQDVAVQLQMGQNGLLVLGQQGGQVASLFGQNGALFGAVLAVGAAVGTYLAPNLFKTRDHLKELEEVATRVAAVMSLDFVNATGSMTEEIIELGQVSEDLAKRKLKDGLEAAMNAVGVAQEGLIEKIDQFDKRTVFGKTLPMNLGRIREEFGLTAESSMALSLAAVDVAKGIDGSVDKFDELLAATTASESATVEQKEALRELKSSFTELLESQLLNQRQVEALTALNENFSEELANNTKEALEAAEAEKKHAEMMAQMTGTLQEQIVALELGEEAANRLRLAKQGLSQDEIDQQIALQNRIRELNNEKNAQEEAAQTLEDQARTRKQFKEGVLAQADAIGKSALELLMEQAAVHNLTAELEEAFEAIRNAQAEQEAKTDLDRMTGNVEAIRQSLLTEEEALLESHHKKLADLDEALNNEVILQERYNETKLRLIADFEKKKSDLQKKSGDQEILQGSKLTGHMLDQLGKQFAGVQASNKKMFAAQKAYKIAKATQNTFDAANEALASPYPWPLPQIFAATAVAAGLANVAAIKSSSFEGGGFTGMGARAGGMDGKGGFPAILHPNETVIDHTKGQGQGITIINNVDASGAGADVDMKIASAMQQTSQQTIATVQDLMRRRRM